MNLDGWHDFHVITGGSAAALVGLMFVVISVAPQVGARSKESVRAFISPTVAFFASVLVLSAVMTVPSVGVLARGTAIASVGAGGIVLMIRAGVMRQLRPHGLGTEDLLFYLAFPVLAYGAVLAAGIALLCASPFGPRVLGAAIIGLLVVGLRNAWDLVIFTARKAAEDNAGD